jgi:hypothetical protein
MQVWPMAFSSSRTFPGQSYRLSARLARGVRPRTGFPNYRKFLSAHEEDRYVHISEGEARSIPHQIAINQKLEKIDRWGEALTIATLVTGVVLAAAYLYFKL